MSDYAVVLQKKKTDGNYYVVKASNFGELTDIGFTTTGKVKTFTYNNIKYYSVYNVSTGLFMDYADANKFDALIASTKKKEGTQYNGVSVSVWNNPKANSNITFNNYASLIPAVAETKDSNGTIIIPGDTIYAKLKDETGLCYNYYVWTYTTPYNGTPANPNKFVPGSSGIECEAFANGSLPKAFYDNYINYQFTDTHATNPRLVGQVASLLNNVNQKLLTAFDGFTVAGVNTGVFQFSGAPGLYSTQDFIDYTNALQQWLQIYQQDVDKLQKLTDPEKIYVICNTMGYYNMLGPLDVNLKIKILSVLVDDTLTDWTVFSLQNASFQHRETLALQIVQSVTNDQASQFLQLLTSTIITDITSVSGGEGGPGGTSEERNSLYKLLFDKINDFGGALNFTAYIQKLNQLILYINGITPDDNSPSLDELKSMTKYQFLWGAVDDKNKIIYSVKERNDATITFIEKVPVETVIEVAFSNSLGIVSETYPEKVIQYVPTEFTLNHYDLVSIHFYENPSFIDTTNGSGYKGTQFITFAGFVDYIIAKEDTKLVESIATVALFAISLTIGFGELVTAIRTLSIARALAGAMIISGDVSTYLSTDSQFRSYIQANYPNDYQNILSTMQAAGIIASLGGPGASSAIFDAFDPEEAGSFIGMAQKILNDPNLAAELTENEKNILREGLYRFSKGSNPIRNTPTFTAAINKSRGVINFYDDVALKAQIVALTDVNQATFFSTFTNISTDFAQKLKLNDDYIEYWTGLSDAEKEVDIAEQLNAFTTWYKAKVVTLAQALLDSGTWKDVRTGGDYALSELESLVEMNIKYKANLRPSAVSEAGDAIATSGALEGKSFDVMGISQDGFKSTDWVNNYTRSYNNFMKSVKRHLAKISSPKNGLPPLDKLIIDFKNFDEFNLSLRINIMNEINGPNFEYKDLVNSEHFETIN